MEGLILKVPKVPKVNIYILNQLVLWFSPEFDIIHRIIQFIGFPNLPAGNIIKDYFII